MVTGHGTLFSSHGAPVTHAVTSHDSVTGGSPRVTHVVTSHDRVTGPPSRVTVPR